MKTRKTFFVRNRNKRVAFEPNQSVLDAILKSKQKIDHECGGQGICGTCRVFVFAGNSELGPKNSFECARSEDFGYHENERLACQVAAHSELIIEIPSSNIEGI
ncbi:MAG: (2Fe-2S)-binding protein [Bdellovibrionales bacterium]|nr:(2Fe-2S)-binding protein [Bdellovibrionales bacterium]